MTGEYVCQTAQSAEESRYRGPENYVTEAGPRV
jgi:hypothetical protein